MTIPEDKLTIVWVGRFLRSGGYGAATRGIYRALQEGPFHLVGIDIDTRRPIDDRLFPHFSVTEQGSSSLSLRANDPERRVIVVVHELPALWNSVAVEGRSHLAGYTVTETEQIPFDWTQPMLGVDRVFVATDFNKAILVSAGLPDAMISVLPHAVDARHFSPRSETIPLRGANSFRFLSLVSNFNRKDIGRVIRAYCDAFSPGDDVSLVVKLPDSPTETHFSRYVVDAVFPWIDLKNDALPHIILFSENMTDEKLVELYASCHAYVSLERGKGWDLPSLEAMLMGLPSIGIDWGGSTQFQNKHNTRLIEPLGATAFTSDDLVLNKELYSGHTWSTFDITRVATEMRRMRENYTFERARVRSARADLERMSAPSAVVEAMRAYVSRLEAFNFRSNATASITLAAEAGARTLAAPSTRGASYESLDPETRIEVDRASVRGSDLEAWVGNRRKIWGKVGPVLPPEPELERTRRLRNCHLGESIFIIGNGPSLSKVDMGRLENHYTFAANRIYLMFDRTPWRPDFYAALDWRVTPRQLPGHQST